MAEKVKNKYQEAREKAGLSREKASEATGISISKIERIEYGDAYANPYEICEMAKVYKEKNLYNYFCAEECHIGNKLGIPKVDYESDDLSRITLKILSILNTIDKDKESLIDVTADDQVSEDELDDFKEIQSHLNQMETYVKSLQMYLADLIDSQ